MDVKSESAIIMEIGKIGEVKMTRKDVSRSLRLRGGIRINGARAF